MAFGLWFWTFDVCGLMVVLGGLLGFSLWCGVGIIYFGDWCWIPGGFLGFDCGLGFSRLVW